MRQIAVDTGGTFTDVVSVSSTGVLRVHKLLSTPDDPGRAIRDGVVVVSGGEAFSLVHGTTVATNALLERRGAHVGLVTTRGFEDVLRLARQNRPDLYALRVEASPPLIARDHTFGARERLGPRGEVLQELFEDAVREVVEWVRENEFEAVAVALLHSYANPRHEEILVEAIGSSLPQIHLTRSSEIVPEFREYERTSTAAVNAYVGPVMSDYLTRLAATVDGPLDVFLSSGGRTSAAHAAHQPVHTVLSGPAGGVVGAVAAAEAVGARTIISFDMGGTSTDVSFAHGQPLISRDASVGGVPVRVPVVDIETVGAGGGSIGWRDRGGALRVGPQSAGANPGPASYGNGGQEPTVTDAHVVLGRLRPDRFLQGEMSLDVDAAHAAISRLAGSLELSIEETALGILDVADAAMVRAIKVVSLERGHDPRECALVSFGGAGGLHAARIATALEITRVVIPRHPGLLSAWGMLRAPRQQISSQSVMVDVSESDKLTAAADELASRHQLPGAIHSFVAALRYRGQSFELEIDWDRERPFEELVQAFHSEHERVYGYRADRPVECTVVRMLSREDVDVVASTPPSDQRSDSGEVAQVRFSSGWHEARIVERSQIAATIAGPAVITELSGTTVVPPGWTIRPSDGHLLMESVQ